MLGKWEGKASFDVCLFGFIRKHHRPGFGACFLHKPFAVGKEIQRPRQCLRNYSMRLWKVIPKRSSPDIRESRGKMRVQKSFESDTTREMMAGTLLQKNNVKLCPDVFHIRMIKMLGSFHNSVVKCLMEKYNAMF